jgi:hypothetical protein
MLAVCLIATVIVTTRWLLVCAKNKKGREKGSGENLLAE